MLDAMFPVLALIPMLLLAGAARADDDHDRAREAVLAGRALPLRTILQRVATDLPGELIEAELEDEHGRLVYEIKVITPDGRVVKALYDAVDGRRLSSREKRR